MLALEEQRAPGGTTVGVAEADDLESRRQTG
jgi:hypothetical protein